MTKPRAYQALGEPDAGQSGNGNMILSFGPRYAKPLDNTMIMSVWHRTTDGAVSVLLDDLSVESLTDWLEGDECSLTINDLQTSAVMIREFGYVHFAISWHGSGRTRRITLTEVQAEALAKWLRTEALTYQWNGWLAPADVPAPYHDHTKINGIKEWCRLCHLKGS